MTLDRSGMRYRLGAGIDFNALMININYQGTTYQASGDNATYKDPTKLIFGLDIKLGNHSNDNGRARRAGE